MEIKYYHIWIKETGVIFASGCYSSKQLDDFKRSGYEISEGLANPLEEYIDPITNVKRQKPDMDVTVDKTEVYLDGSIDPPIVTISNIPNGSVTSDGVPVDGVLKVNIYLEHQQIWIDHKYYKEKVIHVTGISYEKARIAEYPSIGDQLDAIWKGGFSVEQMKQKIMEVKQKYPKPKQGGN